MRRHSFTSEQDRVLTEVYVEVKIPSDTLASDSDGLRQFVALYRERSRDEAHSGKEVVARVITLRKNRRLPRLGDGYREAS